jgi:hypothetical protein
VPAKTWSALPIPAEDRAHQALKSDLGNDIGHKAVFEVGKPVPNGEFLLLEALDRQMIAASGFHQRLERGIQIAVFLPQAAHFLTDLIDFFFVHKRLTAFSNGLVPQIGMRMKSLPQISRDWDPSATQIATKFVHRRNRVS